ncbi:Glycosyl hydrolase, family 15, partial [Pseudomonas syringae pv. maculicola]
MIDFMPMNTSGHVVRMVVGLSGQVEFGVDLAIRFDYGSSVPWVERKDAHTLTAVA